MATLVPCLTALRNEFNLFATGRDKGSDGWIGDAAHAKSKSDHNPAPDGQVHAIDVDVDLRLSGWNMQKAVEIIVTRHRGGRDDRLQNLIYNRRIWSRSWGWTAREYNGPNPHDHHAHFGARYTTDQENDTSPWGLLDAVEGEDDDMATISQKDFDARMDAWWLARMAPGVKDNPARSALRVAPWQQIVGNGTETTHNVLFGQMLGLLRLAAGDQADEQEIARLVLAGLGGPDNDPGRLVAVLRTVLGDRAAEVGRLLAAASA